MALHQAESAILKVLAGSLSAEEVAKKANLPVDSVLSFSQSLREKGLIGITVVESRRLALTPEGVRSVKDGLPEQRVLAAAKKGAMVSSLQPEEKTVGLVWALKNGWVKIEAGRLTVAKEPEGTYPLQKVLQGIASGNPPAYTDAPLLEKRHLAHSKTEKSITISKLATQPASAQPQGAAQAGAAINQLTRDMLLSGSWRGKSLREYDVSAPAEIPPPAKRHMVNRLRKKISRIFTDMGFEEMSGPEAQSSFWNFDALFQPQDHPARDLADTFYAKGSMPLPTDKALVEAVKNVHEKSWGGKWLEKNAEKTVLRTHTTSLSARYLHEKCRTGAPKKFFATGKVYRNEATDYKHLAEFYQVEGIVVWEGATFRDLLGCLKEFYSKLGFEKIRFQPSYFPYTEPSLEISVYFDKKGQWLELGGAGIFRPEVSIPLCGRYPVLAWGLSLERPLMLLNDMDDIRTFYKSNVGWIRKQKLK
ncbi:MAG: phenylalanine--tRNA ligase subunit alpha [Candidatus Micrarchaeia archaeon]